MGGEIQRNWDIERLVDDRSAKCQAHFTLNGMQYESFDAFAAALKDEMTHDLEQRGGEWFRIDEREAFEAYRREKAARRSK